MDFSFLCNACSLSSLPLCDGISNSSGDVGTPTLRQTSLGGSDESRRQIGDGSYRQAGDVSGNSSADINSADINSMGFLANIKGLPLLHINARSLLPKLSEIRLILRDSKAAFLAVSETWLDESVGDGETAIDDYNFVRRDRNRHGGGVGIYIRKDINFNVRSDLLKENLECIFVDVLFPRTKSFVVGSCYRPPDDVSFLEKFQEVLSLITPGTEMYLLGDLNLCFSRNEGMVKSYKRLLASFSIEQIINEATRITATTSTIIDHFLTNCNSKIRSCGVLNCSFSDHQIIYGVRGSFLKQTSPPPCKKHSVF